jgi:succinylglutamate desuccinylase
MNLSTENLSVASRENGSNSNLESLSSFLQNALAETRLQRYQLQEHTQDIESLKQRVQTLELGKATQIGQDKIVGFLVGAVVLSMLSMVTTLFFKMPQAQPPQAQSAPQVTAVQQ